MARSYFMTRCVGLALVLMCLFICKMAIASPTSDLIPSSGGIQERGMELYSPVHARDVALRQFQMSDRKITLVGYAITATAAVAVCPIGGAAAIYCLAIAVPNALGAWALVFLVSGETTGHASPAKKAKKEGILIEAGEHHVVNAGEGHYELDELLLSRYSGNDTYWIRKHLDRMRESPAHVLELHHHHDGTKSVTAHLPGQYEANLAADEDDKTLETRKPKVKVGKVQYAWKGNKKPTYQAIGKRDVRKSDVRSLGKKFAHFIAAAPHKSTCALFYDDQNHKNVDAGVLYLNSGKGVPRSCY